MATHKENTSFFDHVLTNIRDDEVSKNVYKVR